MSLAKPFLYAILDYSLLQHSAVETAESLARAGVSLIQYRHKQASSRRTFEEASVLAARLHGTRVPLVVNDRPDIAALLGAHVHVGQDDVPVMFARSVCGPDAMVGVSTHTADQVKAADRTSADYIAVGPIFATCTKQGHEPVVGLQLIRRARQLTRKTLVAIGGLTPETAVQAIAEGADGVAVAGDLLRTADPAARASEYLRAFAGA